MRDLIPKDVAALAHDHWLDQPPAHPFINDFVAILFAVLVVVNVFGNCCTLYCYLKEPSLRKPSNLLVVNLAISDMTMIITNGIPLVYNAFYENWWIFGKTWCTQYGLWGGITGLCSLWTLVFIGYDRHNTIVGGFTSQPVSTAKALAFIIFCWGYPVLILIWPAMEIWSRWTLEGLLVSCSFDYLALEWEDKTYQMFIWFSCYVVPIVFIIYFYTFIVKAVWAHESNMKAQAKKMNVKSLRQDDGNQESAEMKIAKVAVTNVLLWYITWTPYAAIVAVAQWGDRNTLTPFVAQLPSMLAKTSSCFNPIVFVVSHPKFREAMATHIPCFRSEPSAAGGEPTKTVAA